MKDKRGKLGWAILISFVVFWIGIKVLTGAVFSCIMNPLGFQECWCDYGYLGFRCDCDVACAELDATCEEELECYR